MAKKKVTRKQLLKEPDEFITTTGKVIGWAKENTRSLVIGVLVFFALITIVSVYGYINGKSAAKAQLMFSQAVTKYETAAQQKSDEEALAAVSADFDTLINSYGNQSAGRFGRIFYGHISAAGKVYDQAIVHYQSALDDFGGDSSLTNVILNGLGSAYQQKGEYPQAIENYKKIVDGPGSMLKDVALFHLGKLYAQIGKVQESEKAYQQLNTDFPNSMYANIVREKIAG
jgi:tetratricopeptide (TPR) repeat protein